ncbi:hypothetical protein RQP46_001873 [Phenoliferia psychrophenolica]
MLNRLTGGAGYNPIGAPTSSHIVGGPSRQEDADLELGDLGSSAYYDEVSLLKSSLASFDSSITTLGMRHVQGGRVLTAEDGLAVKPDASEAEVKEVAGSRTEGAQAALSEAQSRREEVLKIEQTLTELAQLFNQVAELVAAQDASIITIEDTTRQVEVDTGYGVEQIGLAKASAAAARHKRKLCAAFFFVILLVMWVS